MKKTEQPGPECKVTVVMSESAKQRVISELKLIEDKINTWPDDDRKKKMLGIIRNFIKQKGGEIIINTKDLGLLEPEFVTQLLGDISCYFFGVS